MSNGEGVLRGLEIRGAGRQCRGNLKHGERYDRGRILRVEDKTSPSGSVSGELGAVLPRLDLGMNRVHGACHLSIGRGGSLPQVSEGIRGDFTDTDRRLYQGHTGMA